MFKRNSIYFPFVVPQIDFVVRLSAVPNSTTADFTISCCEGETAPAHNRPTEEIFLLDCASRCQGVFMSVRGEFVHVAGGF